MTPGDLADALEAIAARVRRGYLTGVVVDVEGLAVGEWSVEATRAVG